MKMMIVFLSALVLIGCTITKETRMSLMPVADNCLCQLYCDVRSTVGNTVMGDMRLTVRNDSERKLEVTLPEQDAQLLQAGEVSTYRIAKQSAQSVDPGKTATFVMSFAMSASALKAQRQMVLLIDGKAHIVGLRIEK